jgi:hypothetical protein
MYVDPNFQTKKAFKEAVARGDMVEFFQPGLGPPAPKDGKILVEGPHYPKPHSWYASVELRGGKVAKIS